MQNKGIFGAISALVIFIYLFAVPVNISAAEGKAGRITLENSTPGMRWNIYRVADANEDGTLEPENVFSEYSIPKSYDHREEIQTLARTFESYIKAKGISPADSREADANGKAVFTDLSEGWYTVVPQKLITGGTVYESAAVMVCVSSCKVYSDVWGTDVRVCPKVITSSRIPDSSKKIVVKFEGDPSTPESEEPIIVIIYRDDEEYDRIVLDRNNDWTIVLPDMPDDDTDWTIIQEDAPDDVFPLYHKETDRTDDIPVDILTLIHKRHYDHSVSNPFVSVTVTTFPSDNSPEASQVTSDTVTETSVPETTADITSVTEDSGLPQTGQLWWPVAVLAAAGALLTAAGTVLRSKDGDQ